MNTLLLAVGLLSGLVSSTPVVDAAYAVKERHPVPRSWVLDHKSAFSKSQSINLQFGLRPANEGLVEKHLLEVSDPSHSRYGQHLTADDVHSLAAPATETLDLVRSWLASHGITNIRESPAQDWINIRVPISTAERLLQTTYSRYRHAVDGDYLIRTPEWSLPKHLHQHIDVVQPTNSFFRTSAHRSHMVDKSNAFSSEWWERVGKYQFAEDATTSGPQSIDKVCNASMVTVKCLRTLYGTIDYKAQSNGKSQIGIANYLNNTAYRKDAEQFLKTFRPDAVSAAKSFKTVLINHGTDDQGNYTEAQLDATTNSESNLDSQLVLGISYPVPLTTYNTGGLPPEIPDASHPTGNTNEPYLEWVNYLSSQKSLPQVLSTSYGDDEETVPESYAKKICSSFAQLGARGISIVFSSGDKGVGPSNHTCVSNTNNKTEFIPVFPASCPWVTAVGATENIGPEIAADFGSGAGFSNYFAQPDYQKSTIDEYVKNLKGQYDGLYNKQGRAYPDVSAQGENDLIVYDGQVISIGGTSASAPTVAAILALVNDALIAEGKPVLGFLNPWLYSTAYKTFTDILSGSSVGCDGNGFPATKGWDAVTGFGTPNFKQLLEAAKKKTGASSPPSYPAPPGYPAPPSYHPPSYHP